MTQDTGLDGAKSRRPNTAPKAGCIVELEDIHFSYQSGPKVLEGVSLEVHSGQYLALLGPNGGGKTTLIKILLGLLRPSQGRVRVFGQSPELGRKRIGYLPQYAEDRDDFPVCVLDAVLMGLRSRHRWGWRYAHDEIQKADKALDQVGMAGSRDELLNHLSGGERQRVFIARALVADPELLILDEPTSNIDPQAKFCFYEFLAQLKAQVSIIVISHDLSITTAHIDAIACVNKDLLYNPSPELTQDMFDLLYGMHDGHVCPMTGFGPSQAGFMNHLRRGPDA